MRHLVIHPFRYRRVGQYGEGERPVDPAELASRLLTSAYMGTEVCVCVVGGGGVGGGGGTKGSFAVML
jgi:hypothetical protein